MTRIDHAGKARQILAEIPDGATEAGTMAWCAEAQVHAQLAMVEQARIANLIALSTPQELIGGGEASVPSWAVEPKPGWKNIGQQEIKLRPDIAAALGLTAGQEGDNDEG